MSWMEIDEIYQLILNDSLCECVLESTGYQNHC